MNILVILAAGIGSRYDSDIPKQYTMLNGKVVLDIVLEEMGKSKADKILLVVSKERINKDGGNKNIDIIVGGDVRAHSFQNAINYINKKYPMCRNIVFHEAARPLISAEIINKYFDLLEQYDYVETCARITDSLGSYTNKHVRREDFYLIQAPEAYRLEVLNKYFDCDSDIYFAANQFPECVKGYQCFDVGYNFKLTTKNDKKLIEMLLGKYSNKMDHIIFDETRI